MRPTISIHSDTKKAVLRTDRGLTSGKLDTFELAEPELTSLILEAARALQYLQDHKSQRRPR